MRKIAVTGANGGIGRAIVAALLEGGVDVVATCRTDEKCEAFRREMGLLYSGAKLETVVLDLESGESVRRAAAALSRKGIFALVNNAGVMQRHYEEGEGGVEKTLLVNYHHTRLLSELTAEFLPQGGCEVFTTSITRMFGSRNHLPGQISREDFGQLKTYALSKKLITRYAIDLSVRLKERGIRVNCADPGIVDSGMITMHRWYDPLADLLFRPVILKPETGASAALRALASAETGRIFRART